MNSSNKFKNENENIFYASWSMFILIFLLQLIIKSSLGVWSQNSVDLLINILVFLFVKWSLMVTNIQWIIISAVPLSSAEHFVFQLIVLVLGPEQLYCYDSLSPLLLAFLQQPIFLTTKPVMSSHAQYQTVNKKLVT